MQAPGPGKHRREPKRRRKAARWLARCVLVPLAAALMPGQGPAAGDSSDVVSIPDLRPAEIHVIPLAELGVNLEPVSAVPAGGITDALVADGILRFATGEDTGRDQPAEVRLGNGQSTVRMRATVRTAWPTQAALHREGDQEAAAPGAPSPRLEISGLGPHNEISGAELRFILWGAPALDARASDGFIAARDGTIVTLGPLWSYDPKLSSFTIPAREVATLLARLPAGPLDGKLNFVSPDGSFAEAWEFLALKPSARIVGEVVAARGSSTASLASRKILLRGTDNDLRRVAVTDAMGRFAFEHLVPDTYLLTLLDLRAPESAVATVSLPPDRTEASVTLVAPAMPAR